MMRDCTKTDTEWQKCRRAIGETCLVDKMWGISWMWPRREEKEPEHKAWVHPVGAKKKDTGTTEVGEGEGILGEHRRRGLSAK